MQFIFEAEGQEWELDLRVSSPAAAVAHLAGELSGSPANGAPGLLIGDRYVGPDAPLAEAGLYEGATVRLANEPEPPSAAAPSGLEVRVVSGLAAGDDHPLGAWPLLVGRAPSADVVINNPSVSRSHCRLSWSGGRTASLEDLGSKNGTWVGGRRVSQSVQFEADEAVVEVGDVRLVVGVRRTDDRLPGVDPRWDSGAGGRIPSNRPARTALTPGPGPLEVPTVPSRVSRRPFRIGYVLAPLGLGLIVAIASHSWLYALIMLLTPVMGLISWYRARHHGERSLRREVRAYQEQLDAFRRQLMARRQAEMVSRRATYTDPAEVVRRATLPSLRLWERRPGDPDFLRLSVGLGDVPWRPELADAQRRALPAEVADALVQLGVLELVPVPVDLAAGGVVGIIGEREAALAVARNLLCQVACHHGPADLAVAVVSSRGHAAAWDWAKWLPHTRYPAAGGGTRLLAGSEEESQALIESLTRAGPATEARPEDGGASPRGVRTLLAVIDDPKLARGRSAPSRDLLRGTAGGAAGIVIASSEDRLPAVCGAVIDVGASSEATLRRPRLGEALEALTVAGCSEATARRFARGLARYDDPELRDGGAGLPDAVSLLPLLGLSQPGAGEIRARWREARPDPGAATPIGVGEDGPFVLDLVRHGPHGLVGGTSGSGKSELLRSLVAGLAASADPDHLNFVLIDITGGGAFDECARLPHTVGMLGELDGQLLDRALTSLNAELADRERVLREAGAADLPAYLELARTRSGLAPLPRLIVVVDEFAALANGYPDQMEALVGGAERGRSMGVHLILATRKPSACVSDTIRASCRLRIALRFEDSADSLDVIESADAVRIGEPGRAYLRPRAGEAVAIQSARVTGVTAQTVDAVDLAYFEFGLRARRDSTRPEGSRDVAGPTDLVRLVEAIQAACAAEGLKAPRRPWPGPLAP